MLKINYMAKKQNKNLHKSKSKCQSFHYKPRTWLHSRKRHIAWQNKLIQGFFSLYMDTGQSLDARKKKTYIIKHDFEKTIM
jgi:hypothetical protein